MERLIGKRLGSVGTVNNNTMENEIYELPEQRRKREHNLDMCSVGEMLAVALAFAALLLVYLVM